MPKNLVIVESPAKAKTIEKFLGKDFTVKSSYGHIRDLDKGDAAIDIKNNYNPKYVVAAEKKALVTELKKLAKESDTVWLASDEDREGEAISWHLFEVLGLKEENTKRIVFHEITKPAIENAIKNPRHIDKHLVDAQQARRVLDRLVGFELSPILWKKVRPSLSAGRVQSVAVRLIVEREREINAFNATSDYKITAQLLKQGDSKLIKAELPQRFKTKEQAEAFLNACINASYSVGNIEIKPAQRKPAAPFTTSTLQQEASRKLGYPVAKTMLLAQKLYEAGLITYMRTDSVNLSQTAIAGAAAEIKSAYGEQFSQPRNYTTKTAGAQEAHEAIRPTYFNNHSAGDDPQEKKLYELIWKRAIASQMANAELEKTIVDINVSGVKESLRAEGEVLKFEGFLKVYLEGSDDEEDEDNAGMLPPLKVGESLNLQDMTAEQKFTRPAPRYTEASLVKKLEELGIGRPSTYAPTISTIQKRGYVVRENREGRVREYTIMTLKNGKITAKTATENTGAEKGKLFPTDIGSLVTDFLTEHFTTVLDYGFTASVEKEFDDIATGMVSWVKMIDRFYNPFHKTVNETLDTAERVRGERELGNDPESGKKIIGRIGRFGPLVQIGENTETEKARFASLRPGQSLDTITLEQALDLFKLPREVGSYEGKGISAAIGRFGPYLKFDNLFVSIPKDKDPYTITEPEAIELIEAKKLAESQKLIKSFKEEEGLDVLNGRFGPYISYKKSNYKIPKGTDPKSLTYEQVMDIITKSDEASPKKKAAAKKAPAAKKAAPAKKAAAKKAAPAKKKAPGKAKK